MNWRMRGVMFANGTEEVYTDLHCASSMAQFRILGQQPIAGSVRVAGAKNHALAVIPAAFLSLEELELVRVPDIGDARLLLEMVEEMGARVTRDEKDTVRIDTRSVKSGDVPVARGRGLRASAILIGPLLARFGAVTMAHPGGCLLGRRPIDLFVDGFRAMGATIKEADDTICFAAKKLKGATIFMSQISVTVTETLMMAATLADGDTVLQNAACEPEIPALAAYL